MKLWKCAIFFIRGTGRLKIGKGGGNIENFLKMHKILTPCLWTGGENVSMQNILNKDRNSDFGTTRMPSKSFFSFNLQKLIKRIKLVTFVLNARLVLNFKNKSNRICIKKRKINHDPENRRTVNCNKTKLCISQRL